MTAAVKVTVRGGRDAQRRIRRSKAMYRRAQASAMKKVANTTRGTLRRYIVSSEGVPLKTTRRRVQWFWKARRGDTPTFKMWVGTQYKITGAETAKLRNRKPVDLEEIKPEMRRLIGRTVMKRIGIEFRSQLKRFGW